MFALISSLSFLSNTYKLRTSIQKYKISGLIYSISIICLKLNKNIHEALNLKQKLSSIILTTQQVVTFCQMKRILF